MDRVYFNDEWNEPISLYDKFNKSKYEYVYNIIFDKLDNLLREELLKKHTDGKTVLPKEYDKKKN